MGVKNLLLCAINGTWSTRHCRDLLPEETTKPTFSLGLKQGAFGLSLLIRSTLRIRSPGNPLHTAVYPVSTTTRMRPLGIPLNPVPVPETHLGTLSTPPAIPGVLLSGAFQSLIPKASPGLAADGTEAKRSSVGSLITDLLPSHRAAPRSCHWAGRRLCRSPTSAAIRAALERQGPSTRPRADISC